jgi:uncharacterized protein (DUF362 family)
MPIEMNLIIIGINPVAVDVVAATVMEFDPAQINYSTLYGLRARACLFLN